MENNEGSEGTPTKISDSGYSNSCGNSQSQRSGSSKSRHCGSNSSGSSDYGGKTSSSLTNSNEATPQPSLKHKELKKKKSKNTSTIGISSPETSITTDRNSSTRNTSPNTERTENEENTSPATSLLTNNVTTTSQQLIDDSNKDCLSPISIHSLHNAHISSPCNDELTNNISVTPNPSLKAGFPIPPTGDVISTPDIVGGKITDNEIVFSPLKLTNDSHFISKNYTPCVKNQSNNFSTPLSGFSCVVSMRDGIILYTNSSTTTALGYPKDMWLGRSFMDFVHPKDRPIFSSHITTAITVPLTKSFTANKENEGVSVVFCRMRRYRGLRGGPTNTGYGVRERDVSYTPFQLDFSFKDVTDIENNGIYLMITGAPIASPYLDFKDLPNSFTTRHTSMGTLNHIDPEGVKYIGYLPQDIIGKSIFEFYHPEDMLYIKEAYGTVLKSETSIRSRQYRLRVHNGDFVKVETDWSTFINPWSNKLEFIIGQHHIIQGPINMDVFQSISKNEFIKKFTDESLKQHRQCQEDILKIMNEVLIKPTETEKHQISKRCKELATFMEGCAEKPRTSQDELRIEIPKEKSLSERDSVMLGEISPHHDYCDSKSSIETPPSYNQLNYNENIQRFFESHPWTSHQNPSPDIKPKIFPESDQSTSETFNTHEKCCSPMNVEFGESEESNNTADSNNGKTCHVKPLSHTRASTNSPQKCYITPIYNSNDYKPAHLTQDILTKHNSSMEKLLVKKYKEARSVSKAEEREKGERREKIAKINHFTFNLPIQSDLQVTEQGLKRSNSLTWDNDGECHKLCKQTHLPQPPHLSHQPNTNSQVPLLTTSNDMNVEVPTSTSGPNQTFNATNNNQFPTQVPNATNNMNHQYVNSIPVSGACGEHVNWPPFSMTITPFQQTQAAMSTDTTNQNTIDTVYPAMYLVPTQQIQVPQENTRPSNSTNSLFRYMMYPSTVFETRPFIYSHVAMAYQPLAQTIAINPLLPATAPAQIKPLGLPFDNYRQACQKIINNPLGKIKGNSMKSREISKSRSANPMTRVIPSKAEPGNANNDTATTQNAMTTKPENPTGISVPHCDKEPAKEECYGDTSSYSYFSCIMKTASSSNSVNANICGETSVENDKSDNKSDTIESKGLASESTNSPRTWDKSSQQNEGSSITSDPTEKKDDAASNTQSTSDNNLSTDKEENPPRRLRKLQPPWLDSVCLTPELMYRYQITPKNLDDVLKADQTTLDSIHQPALVNEQLSQLYDELEMENSSELKLDESSRENQEYMKLMMIYEEDAPLPSPTAD